MRQPARYPCSEAFRKPCLMYAESAQPGFSLEAADRGDHGLVPRNSLTLQDSLSQGRYALSEVQDSSSQEQGHRPESGQGRLFRVSLSCSLPFFPLSSLPSIPLSSHFARPLPCQAPAGMIFHLLCTLERTLPLEG